jgi:hypothetical protein
MQQNSWLLQAWFAAEGGEPKSRTYVYFLIFKKYLFEHHGGHRRHGTSKSIRL